MRLQKYSILLLLTLLFTACQEPVRRSEIICGGPSNFRCAPWMYCDLGEFCGGIDKEGVCKIRPEYCNDDVEYVCGCDGTTYLNACWAAAKGKPIRSTGECANNKDQQQGYQAK